LDRIRDSVSISRQFPRSVYYLKESNLVLIQAAFCLATVLQPDTASGGTTRSSMKFSNISLFQKLSCEGLPLPALYSSENTQVTG
jgi:hypothetical protein